MSISHDVVTDSMLLQNAMSEMHRDLLGMRGLDVYEKQTRLQELHTAGVAYPTPAPAIPQNEKDALHEEVEALGLTNPAVCIAVHALIDSGRITELVCKAPHCFFPGMPFKNGGRRNPTGLSLDHIILQCDGGGHRPNNIRLMHYRCNCSWSTGRGVPHTEEQKAAAKARGEAAGWSWAKAAGPKIAAALRGRELSEEHRNNISIGLSVGKKVDATPVECKVCGRVFKGARGLKIHQNRTNGACA